MKRQIGLIIGCLWIGQLAAQGPISGFMLEKGTHDFAVNAATENFDTYIFGDEEEARDYEAQSLSIYYEYGFSNKSSVVFTAPYISIDEGNQGLQDGSLFFKFRNKHADTPAGKLSIITALGISAPLSSYPTDTDNPIGFGAPSFQGRLVAQHNFSSGAFVHLQSGVDFRLLDQIQTSIPILLRGGYGTQYYFVEAWAEWFDTLRNGIDQNVTGGSGSDWLRLGGTVYVPVYKGLGLVGGVAYIVAGKNIGLSNRYHLGAVYRLKKQDEE